MGIEGAHRIRLKENGVRAVFTKKQEKLLGLHREGVHKERLLPASAYDENQLGTHNVLFVKIPGLEHYATFYVDNDFSVYKVPKFSLEILDGAIEVIE